MIATYPKIDGRTQPLDAQDTERSPIGVPSAQSVWAECMELVQTSITQQAFKTWFEPTKAIRLDGATLTVQVPSRFFYEWIEEHYYSLVRKSIVQVIGDSAQLIYHAAGEDVAETAFDRAVTLPVRPAAVEHPSDAPQRRQGPVFSPLASTMFQQPVKPAQHPGAQNNGGAPPMQSFLNARFTFDNFITGDCNQLAYAAAKAIADNPGGTRFNPLVVYGGVGLGKTHLAQAIGHEILRSRPDCSVVYTSSERFTYEFVNAIQHNKSQEFTNYYRSVDVLIVDDIQFFADKEKTQDNFFHTFNALHQSGKQIILTSDVPPKQLRGVDDRLISRFQWGLTTDMQPPDLETRIAILQKMSSDEGYQLPGDVIDYIARNVTTSVRELEGCLITLLAECSLRNLSLTLDLTREVISGIASVPDPVLNVEQIQTAVCTQLGIPHSLLVGKTRKQEIVFARQVAMFLIRELTGVSLKTIGNHFGGRDHTTVMHAISTIETQRTRDDHTRRTLGAVRRELNVPDR